jgi:hypothetical protein
MCRPRGAPRNHTHAPTHALTHKLTHSLTHSLAHSRTCSLTRSPTPSPSTHSHTSSHTPSHHRRGFVHIDFQNANLLAAAKSLAPSTMRFGGGGNDYLHYAPFVRACMHAPHTPPALHFTMCPLVRDCHTRLPHSPVPHDELGAVHATPFDSFCIDMAMHRHFAPFVRDYHTHARRMSQYK